MCCILVFQRRRPFSLLALFPERKPSKTARFCIRVHVWREHLVTRLVFTALIRTVLIKQTDVDEKSDSARTQLFCNCHTFKILERKNTALWDMVSLQASQARYSSSSRSGQLVAVTSVHVRGQAGSARAASLQAASLVGLKPNHHGMQD